MVGSVVVVFGVHRPVRTLQVSFMLQGTLVIWACMHILLARRSELQAGIYVESQFWDELEFFGVLASSQEANSREERITRMGNDREVMSAL